MDFLMLCGLDENAQRVFLISETMLHLPNGFIFSPLVNFLALPRHFT